MNRNLPEAADRTNRRRGGFAFIGAEGKVRGGLEVGIGLMSVDAANDDDDVVQGEIGRLSQRTRRREDE